MIETGRMTRGWVVSCLLILLVAFIRVTPLAAQFTTASLGGTVTDSSGASVPEAVVTVQDTETGLVRTVKSGATGDYLFPALPVGTYKLTVEKTGFQVYVQNGIVLTVNQAATQVVVLKVGSVNEQVTVSANASLVTTLSATVGQLVNEQSVVNLPLNGRTAQSLVFLIPGANDVTDSYCGVGCEGGAYPGEQYANVNGGGPNGVNYQMDGTDNNDTYMNTNLPFPNPDAIQEFNVQTGNMSAEYGNAASGIVNVVTKSGTNELHGTAFEFLRNYVFDARNFFAPTRDTLKQNQFGGTLGGPIMKNKLFFFGSYQGTRTRTAPNGQIAVVPTAEERAGDFSSLCATYDSGGLCTDPNGTQLIDPLTSLPLANNQLTTNQTALNVLKYVPPPNAADGVLNYLGPAANTTENEFMGKVDYNRGNHHLSGRYFYTKFREPATPLTDNILQLNPYANQVRVQTIAVNDTYTASPQLLFNTWFGWNKQDGGYIAATPFSANAFGASIAPSPSPQLYIDVEGYFIAQGTNVGAYNRGDQTLREVVSLIKGRNTITFGGELLRVRAPISNQYLQGGEFFFNGNLSGSDLADFMLGDITQFTQGGGIYANITGYNIAAFLQDSWRATSKLTLSGGLRWDPYIPYTDSEDRLPCFQPGKQSTRFPNAPLGLLFAGDAGCPKATVYSSWRNMAPRLGFAYQLTKDGKTSIRGGAGIYYQPPETLAWQDDAGLAPFAPIYTLNVVNFTDPFGSAGLTNPFPADFGPKLPSSDATFTLPTTVAYFFPQGFQKPNIAVWSVILERQLASSTLIKAAYFGTKATHLYPTSDQQPMAEINAARYVPGNSTAANTQDRRPYPDFGPMGIIDSGYNSNYNALQLSLEKRLTHGISFLADYTWSKNINDFSQSASSQSYYQTDPYNRSYNYGPDTSDLPHVIKFSGTWEVPHVKTGKVAGKLLNGWQLSPIVSWRSGFPFSVMSGLDNSFSGDYSDRADFTGANFSQAKLSTGRSHAELIQQFFNTALFQPNAVGTFGNSGKNNVRGPRLFNTDVALQKNTKIGERYTVQFRAEFYNAFNNVNFGQPNALTTDPTFGEITGARDPRIMQFGLKLQF